MESKTVTVQGSKIFYLEAGPSSDKTVLFLHGLSSSSYMWKNIIPTLSAQTHCIAPDLIGIGESDKPNLNYSTSDHLTYLENFINQLDLKNITLVMYGWANIIGLAYAQSHPELISGLVFADPYLYLKKNLQDIPMVLQEISALAQNEPEKLKQKYIEENNHLVEKIIKSSRMNKLPSDAMEYYAKMFSTKESREVFIKIMLDNPYVNPNSTAIPYIKKYSEWLKENRTRKLLLYVKPGFVGTADTLHWATANLANFTAVNVGSGISFFPELDPESFAKALLNWL